MRFITVVNDAYVYHLWMAIGEAPANTGIDPYIAYDLAMEALLKRKCRYCPDLGILAMSLCDEMTSGALRPEHLEVRLDEGVPVECRVAA